MRKLKILKLLSWLKELEEEQSKVRLFSASLYYQKLLEEKRIIEEEYKDCLNYIQGKKSFSGEELKEWLFYLERLKEFQGISEKKIEAQREIVNQLQEELIKRHQERRLMERLREKGQRRLEIERTKREWQYLEDLFLITKGRDFD